jgi:hypothetical protein
MASDQMISCVHCVWSSNVKLQSTLQLRQIHFLDVSHSSIVTASLHVAVPAVEAPAVAIQQNLWWLRCITSVDHALSTYSRRTSSGVSIMQSTHTLHELLKMSLQQSPSIYTTQLQCYSSHTVSRVIIRESVAWMCAWMCMCICA